jgi:hypothetical protein
MQGCYLKGLCIVPGGYLVYLFLFSYMDYIQLFIVASPHNSSDIFGYLSHSWSSWEFVVQVVVMEWTHMQSWLSSLYLSIGSHVMVLRQCASLPQTRAVFSWQHVMVRSMSSFTQMGLDGRSASVLSA